MEYLHNLHIESHPDVYPPSEDSELLVKSFDVVSGERVLEIGCGSGIISIHCSLNGGVVTCGDINPEAVKLARMNAKANNAPLTVVDTDVYSAINGEFDTIIFNLPYLPVDEEGELAKAWSGGEDGLGPLPILLAGADKHLSKGGRFVIVVSSLMDNEKLEMVLKGFDVKVLGELPLFFEVLRILELRLN